MRIHPVGRAPRRLLQSQITRVDQARVRLKRRAGMLLDPERANAVVRIPEGWLLAAFDWVYWNRAQLSQGTEDVLEVPGLDDLAILEAMDF